MSIPSNEDQGQVQDRDLVAAQRDRAAHWCLRLASGSLGDLELEAFHDWLAQDPANARVLCELTALWSNLPSVAELPAMIAARADALQALHAARSSRASRGGGWRWRHLAFAAATVASVAALPAVYYVYRQAWASDVYETAAMERRVFHLADGSTLSLDGGSRVRVQLQRARRALTLETGGATFDVASDPLRPFTVRAAGRIILATGTSFSVALRPTTLRVALMEGHVAVFDEPREGEAPSHLPMADGREADQYLKPGRVLVAALDRSSAEVRTQALDAALRDRRSTLNFSDVPLADAVRTVNRYALAQVRLTDDAVGRLRISGAFQAGDAAGFADGVAALYGLRVAEQDGVLRLGSAGRREDAQY